MRETFAANGGLSKLRGLNTALRSQMSQDTENKWPLIVSYFSLIVIIRALMVPPSLPPARRSLRRVGVSRRFFGSRGQDLRTEAEDELGA